jgi:biotin carboxyl carrier protein
MERLLMANNSLICGEKTRGEGVAILSPGIGRIKLGIGLGFFVESGQVIGEFLRLNQRFLLRLPDGLKGTVISMKDAHRVMTVEFNEVFLELALGLSEEKTRTLPKKNQLEGDIKQTINAPMDGMFYLSPSPKDPDYVCEGDQVMPGQTVGLIEVMKSFYPLKYQGKKPATISAVLVKNGTPVTSGMNLFALS